jgi:hypothetical protein
MAYSGSRTLRDYPHAMVRVACDKCGRDGRHSKAKLMAEHGGEVALPDLRHLIAKCPQHESMGASCGVHFPDFSHHSTRGAKMKEAAG